MWAPSQKEIQSVLSADGRHRYAYFIHRVCETKAVWALFDAGWASIRDEQGATWIPFWPHPAYAQGFVAGDWASFQPRRIALDEFLDAWIPRLREQSLLPDVFPVRGGTSIVVTLDDLESHLRRELDVFYGE